jgi:hypothetical protein
MPISWRDILVDGSQVISAIATAASVAVALLLARRSESQRLKFFVDERRVITVGPEPRTAQEAIATHIKFTIVNAGVLPAHILFVHFRMQSGQRQAWGAVPDADENLRLPKTLNHGELVSFSLAPPLNHFPDGSKFAWWWWMRRAQFDVRTNLGPTTVRLKWKDIRWIRRAATFARNPDEDV